MVGPVRTSDLPGQGRRLAAGIALLCVLGTGCASRAKPGVSRPRPGPWRELRTEHFVIVTDLERRAGLTYARELEELAAALREVYPVRTTRPVRLPPMRVVHFTDCVEAHRIAYGTGPDASGRMQVGATFRSNDFDRDRMIRTCEIEGNRSEVVVHELTHDLNSRYFASLPAWLEEGMATYYQTLALEDGHAVIGKPSTALVPGTLVRLRVQDWDYSDLGEYVVSVQRTRPPTLEHLLMMDYANLVRLGEGMGYFAAWRLTHVLNSGDALRLRFARLLREVLAGRRGNAAFAAAFGDVRRAVEKSYQVHENERLTIWKRPYQRRPYRGAIAERLLRPGEVRALSIDLGLAQIGRQRTLQRLAELDRADPEWHGRLYWHAVVHYSLGISSDEPLHLLRKYVAARPQDPRGWMGLILMQLDQLVPGVDLGISPQAPGGLERIEADARQLRQRAATASQFHALGVYYTFRRRPVLGLYYSRRAVAAEPSCGRCVENLARVYFQLGRVQDAVATQERAIALMAEEGIPLRSTALLGALRQEASSASR